MVVCVRACVRVCVCVCVRACVRVCVRASEHMSTCHVRVAVSGLTPRICSGPCNPESSMGKPEKT